MPNGFTVFWLFIHTLFPPCEDTCNNKHQNIMTSMSFYIHYVRKREEKKINIDTQQREIKRTKQKQNIVISEHELIGNM